MTWKNKMKRKNRKFVCCLGKLSLEKQNEREKQEIANFVYTINLVLLKMFF